MANLFGHAASVGILTLVSRVLGLVRDAVIASVFGSSVMADAFFLAFRPFDLLRKLFSEGVLSLSFIPFFAEYLGQGKRDQAFAMFWSALAVLAFLSLVLGMAGFFTAPDLAGLLAPGYAKGSQALILTGQMLRAMLPYGFTVLILAVCMGGLNGLGSFKGPAATPVLLNISMILAILFLDPDPMNLAWAVTLGGLLQLIFQVPFLMRAGIHRPLRWELLHPGVVRAGKRFFPYMLGASAFQVNLLVSALLASTLAQGNVSQLYFAERLVQFPLALLVTSAATVFLPVLAGTARNPDRLATGIEEGAQMVMFTTMGAMAGIMALDHHIVALLFGRGAFDSQAVAQTSDCLFFLASGLWAMAGCRIYVTCHFAATDVKLPLAAGSISILAHLGLALVLKECMGLPGLALALALSSMAGFVLFGLFSRQGPRIRPLMVSACRALLVSVIMACLVRWTADAAMPAQGALVYRAAVLLGLVGLGMVIFLVTAVWIARPEMAILKRMLIQKSCPEWKN